MRRVFELLLLLQCLSLEAAVVVGAAANPSEWDRVTEQKWLVQEFESRPVLAGTAITVVFDRGGRLSGNAGTNNYRGTYKLTGAGGLVVSILGATKMYIDLPPGRMQQETNYLDTLKSIERFTLEGDELTLWIGGEPSIRYARAQ